MEKVASFAGPNRATVRVTSAAITKPIRTLRLSNNFKKTRPTAQPTVIQPQKPPTALAPSVSGSRPW